MSSGIPRQISEATLRQLYITENLSIREIARELNTRISNMKKIMIFKYGTECYMTSKKGYQQYYAMESAKQNRAQTCIRKYGVDHMI